MARVCASRSQTHTPPSGTGSHTAGPRPSPRRPPNTYGDTPHEPSPSTRSPCHSHDLVRFLHPMYWYLAYPRRPSPAWPLCLPLYRTRDTARPHRPPLSALSMPPVAAAGPCLPPGRDERSGSFHPSSAPAMSHAPVRSCLPPVPTSATLHVPSTRDCRPCYADAREPHSG